MDIHFSPAYFKECVIFELLCYNNFGHNFLVTYQAGSSQGWSLVSHMVPVRLKNKTLRTKLHNMWSGGSLHSQDLFLLVL